MLTLRCADMQKFPLRMKDNDLLVTELYKDPSGNRITALSVYLTQKASQFVCTTFYVLGVVLCDFSAEFAHKWKRFITSWYCLTFVQH